MNLLRFNTDRLTVYVVREGKHRHFIGVNAGNVAAVTASVEYGVKNVHPCGFLWHICTMDGSRRRGLARELWQAIEAHTGRRVVSFGETEAGLALCKSLNRVANERSGA